MVALMANTEPDVDYILRGAKSQLECWHFIDHYKSTHNGNPPPRSEIARYLDCSTQNVDILLMRLAKKKLILMDEFERPMIPWKEYPAPPNSR